MGLTNSSMTPKDVLKLISSDYSNPTLFVGNGSHRKAQACMAFYEEHKYEYPYRQIVVEHCSYIGNYALEEILFILLNKINRAELYYAILPTSDSKEIATKLATLKSLLLKTYPQHNNSFYELEKCSETLNIGEDFASTCSLLASKIGKKQITLLLEVPDFSPPSSLNFARLNTLLCNNPILKVGLFFDMTPEFYALNNFNAIGIAYPI